jgi:hypothetical protein
VPAHDFDSRSQTRDSIDVDEIVNSDAAAVRRAGRGEQGAAVRNARNMYAQTQTGLGRDNLRSKTACNARGLVEDLAHVQTEVVRLLEDRGKEINARTGWVCIRRCP